MPREVLYLIFRTIEELAPNLLNDICHLPHEEVAVHDVRLYLHRRVLEVRDDLIDVSH